MFELSTFSLDPIILIGFPLSKNQLSINHHVNPKRLHILMVHKGVRKKASFEDPKQGSNCPIQLSILYGDLFYELSKHKFYFCV